MTTRTHKKVKKSDMIISYLFLRQSIGILGIAFPVLLVVGSIIGGYESIQCSVSDYYHSNMRNVFVGVLCIFAIFLFSYRGYDKIDSILGNLACFFALGIAFFPTFIKNTSSCCKLFPTENPLIGYIHFTSAALFFIILAIFSIFLFTKKGKHPSRQKIHRNRLYRICGYTMLVCIAIIAIYLNFLKYKFPVLNNYKPVFWLESISLWAFGISWLTKGKVLLQDK